MLSSTEMVINSSGKMSPLEDFIKEVSMKTGYHIIDAEGLNLNDLGKVTGLHKQCTDALAIGKATLFENVVNGDEALIPIPVTLMMASTAVNAYAATGNLSIAANDTVSALV